MKRRIAGWLLKRTFNAWLRTLPEEERAYVALALGLYLQCEEAVRAFDLRAFEAEQELHASRPRSRLDLN